MPPLLVCGMLCHMNLTDSLLPSDLLYFANLIWFAIGLYALRSAPWRLFLANSRIQHVFLGATVVLFLMWNFEMGVHPALGFHFLGLTTFTLMFGWSLGVIGASLVTVAVTCVHGHWAALAMNALVLGVLPVSVSYGVYHLVHRHLPHHLFVYIFLCAFFNAMLAAGVAVMTLVVLLVATDTYTFARISYEHLPYLPLYLFPEGMLNGMVITALIGVRPDWLKTYDDETYLKKY